MNINININKVYAGLLNDQTRTQIIFGGSSSGKSYFVIAQRMILDLLRGGRNYLCVRNTANTLRGSIYNEAIKSINNMGLHDRFVINKSEMTITCYNGFQAILKGLDDVEKIKSITPTSGVLTDILIEEATETKENDVKQLEKRLRGKSDVNKRVTMIFNPVFKTHWIYKEYFAGKFNDSDVWYKDDHVLILKTTYKDNITNLSQDDIYNLENERNEYFYNVYTLGNWGVLGSLIFTNWKVEDISKEMHYMFPRYYGLDFGFTNDPTAFSGSWVKGDQLFITDEMYEYGLTNNIIADRLKSVVDSEIIKCDAAEPKSIQELRDLGINAIACRKGQGSINYGIQYLQQFEIIIHNKLQNAINEFQLYQWDKNRDGETINRPIDRYNHFIDATRYAHDDRSLFGNIASFSVGEER